MPNVIKVTSAADSGPGSLREAVANAKDGDIIKFDRDLDGAAIELFSPIEINKDIDIVGPKDAGITLNLSPNANVFPGTEGGIFSITDGANAFIRDLELSGGRAENGGAIFVAEGASLEGMNLLIQNSFAEKYGGAIRVEGQLNLSDSVIDGNEAMFGGGGISIVGHDAAANITGTQVRGNRAENPDHKNNEGGSAGDGGGIQIMSGPDVLIDNCIIADNNALNRYAGVDAREEGTVVIVTNSEIIDNQNGIIFQGDADVCAFQCIVILENTIAPNSKGVIINDGTGIQISDESLVSVIETPSEAQNTELSEADGAGFDPAHDFGLLPTDNLANEIGTLLAGSNGAQQCLSSELDNSSIPSMNSNMDFIVG